MLYFDPSENIIKSLVFCFQGDQKGILGRKDLSISCSDSKRTTLCFHLRQSQNKTKIQIHHLITVLGNTL